ncbi:hypothetical protein A2966_02205 [Candidatus Roizmanbacteria bacterium RIFCSPLOWO2_01_FULL_41_22]|uniref:Uncharacterized protein n=2 Tax=Candidatus Roizmaniibacteriota TaxID=1752723 RepID=A0A1F7JQ61_9BACT|nr:MAG: hypothetical protein A2966_02205 [Candidatus Roizmanbacteria bacterium RIFCSPLOWO2_01_FULL_41_22]OGK57759.1 MAG: hypothetical protein A3H86_02720 [Candidatus Roizmanbacteria bacterium RIFCSPLOWO2_02_FULL_41_9]
MTIIHDLEEKPTSKSAPKPFIITIIVGAIFLGGLFGFIISKISSSINTTSNSGSTGSGGQKQSAGIVDKKTFKDDAEGRLREGGIDGEGSFHLERPGGTSQNVYLTSATVDLSKFIGKKVRVWGQTFEAQKAGWLMDVGYVEAL